jgi:drug/metabolite transporter superfamily protein YnfA
MRLKRQHAKRAKSRLLFFLCFLLLAMYSHAQDKSVEKKITGRVYAAFSEQPPC